MRKTLLLGLAVILMIALSFSTAHTKNYTYDSIIDPAEFYNWTEINRVQTGMHEGMVAFENPDKNATIRAVILFIRSKWLITYEYIIDDVKYKYEYNFDTKHFGLISKETLGTKTQIGGPYANKD